jgi:polysaccharide export outer membrane protein
MKLYSFFSTPQKSLVIPSLCVLVSGGLVSSVLGQQNPGNRIPKAAPVEETREVAGAQSSAPAGIASSAALVPFDVIQVTVYQESDLDAKVRVTPEGTVLLPLIGAVKVGGKSIRQATEEVTLLYKKDYLVKPEVSIALLEHFEGKERTARLNVLGQVARPGTVDVAADRGTPIIDVIASAGGFTRAARESKITVTRSVGGQQKVFKVNGKEQSTGETTIFLVYPGDTIFVSESLF